MDGFTYHDIFQTKGIEYIIIIAFLVLLIPFWVLINKRAVIATNIRKVMGIITMEVLKIPKGLFYSKNHTWTYLEKSGTAKVGLDDLLIHLTGAVRLNYLKGPDEQVQRGDIIAELHQGGTVLSMRSPISGRILQINQTLEENPGILNQDPYERGWIYNIQPSNWTDETRSYYFSDEAINWSKRELDRFKDFITHSMSKLSAEPALVILQEGGELSDNPLSAMPREIWLDFQEEFLDQPFE
jgi:glycine cleavage system H protein